MENIDIKNIPVEKLVFANQEGKLHDKELETKPAGFLKDAWNRFKKNKGSIVAAIVIGILVLYAIIAPLISQYTVAYNDPYFKYTMPKLAISDSIGWNFMDGCVEKSDGQESFIYYYSMGEETGHNAVKNQKYEVGTQLNAAKQEVSIYTYRLDSYQQHGVIFKNFTLEEFKAIQAYQDEHDIQIVYPITDLAKRPEATQDTENANFWYTTELKNGKTKAINVTFNADGSLSYENIYAAHSGNDQYSSKLIEGSTKIYDYAQVMSGGIYKTRVNYYEYYKYYHTTVVKDRIKAPCFLFGTTSSGQDIFTCLASGARFSFIMAIAVASVNMIVGAIYGAIEGYYGGRADMIMERIVEILSAVPFMIVITLLKYHMAGSSQVLILFISYFLTGWIGTSGLVRMQFYRFKGQEYVLAARTLGASDWRIMFRHIFPNSLGTIITSSVLVIPGMIFSETSLSYLGIINLSTGNLTSVGTLLAGAQKYLATYPHMIVPPALFISLLMLSFNLFGNGLRDAFNPSLRGSED